MANGKKKVTQSDFDAVVKDKPVETLIYIGPTISNISLSNRRTFRGGLSPECERLIKVVPGAKHLFVRTSDFADAEKRLADKTSVEFAMHSRILAAMKEIK